MFKSSLKVKIPVRLSSCVLVYACLFFQATALEFQAEIAGQQRSASIETVEINGVKYLPVDAFCEAFGGSCEAIASQMRVRFADKSAILVFKESEVHATLGSFILGNPILTENSITYIAQQDIADFFQKAFDIQLVRGPGLAPVNLEMETQETIDAESTNLLEPMETAVNVEKVSGLKATSIVIDAGHGGRDMGYTANNGAIEKELTLKLSERLLTLLKENTDARIFATRREDKDLSNSDRVRLANESSGTLFISLHAGVSRSPKANGIDLYITNAPIVGQSRVLASTPQRDAAKSVESSRALAQALAETLASQTGTLVRGIHQAPLRILGEVAMPGVLIEVGFLSNDAEAELLSQEAYLDKLAQAILVGIQQATAGEKSAS